MQLLGPRSLTLWGLVLLCSHLLIDVSATFIGVDEEKMLQQQSVEQEDGASATGGEPYVPLADSERMFEKVVGFARKDNTLFRRGGKTTLVGVGVLLAFLAMHYLQVYFSKPGAHVDFMFRSDSGSTTSVGTGMILGAVLLGVGLGSMIASPMLPKDKEQLFMHQLSWGLATRGMLMVQVLSIVLLVGHFLLPFPFLLMSTLTVSLLIGAAFALIGGFYTMRDIRNWHAYEEAVAASRTYVDDGDLNEEKFPILQSDREEAIRWYEEHNLFRGYTEDGGYTVGKPPEEEEEGKQADNDSTTDGEQMS